MDIQELIEVSGAKMGFVSVDDNPHMDDMPCGSKHYLVTLKVGKVSRNFYFSMGPAHTAGPTLTDVLSCLISDYVGVENSSGFEDWAAEYGYSADNRKAFKTFKAVKRNSKKVVELFPSVDLLEVEGN